MSDITARIADHLTRSFPAAELADDDDFFELGLISTVFAVRLVAFVEHEFAITVRDEDLEPVHFRSIAALRAFVEGKLSVPVAS
ncbi:acyl carrier protein [Actinokineospora sp. G85]|uniref:acyl carrier protein n=1 Tax=Actinokineospora sp. G85 TaxID=3406626 RepID=UPI003C7388B9